MQDSSNSFFIDISNPYFSIGFTIGCVAGGCLGPVFCLRVTLFAVFCLYLYSTGDTEYWRRINNYLMELEYTACEKMQMFTEMESIMRQDIQKPLPSQDQLVTRTGSEP